MSRSSLRERNLKSSGTSSQTEIQPCDVLVSDTSRYEFQYFRFTGCFGKVAQCKNLDTTDAVAIKILNKRDDGSQEPIRELAMLERIRGLNPDTIVRFFEGFEHKGHTCLVFEMLDKSLHELLNERRGNPLSLQEIKPITEQLLKALESLKTVGVIHTNIKPRTIMLIQNHQPARVKLIDFGSAVPAAEVKRGVIMQPVAYRSPDVILGLPISEAIDMWSLGGVLATMYLGSLPFPQRCQYCHMKTIVETLGQPEDHVLSDGIHTPLYFNRNQDFTKPAWRLNTADVYKAVTRFPSQRHRGLETRFKSLVNLLRLNPRESFKFKLSFVNLLRSMLHLNPQKRITPSDALRHTFIVLAAADYEDSSVVGLAEEPTASAAAESSHVHSAAGCLGVESVPAARPNDGSDVSAAHALRAESIDAGSSCTSLSTGGDSDAGGAYKQASAAPVTTDLYDAVPAEDGPVTADEAAVNSVSATGSRISWGKTIRRFLGRMFRALWSVTGMTPCYTSML